MLHANPINYVLRSVDTYDLGFDSNVIYGKVVNFPENKCYAIPVMVRGATTGTVQIRDYKNNIVRNITCTTSSHEIMKLDSNRFLVIQYNNISLLDLNGHIYFEKYVDLYDNYDRGDQSLQSAIIGTDGYLYLFGYFRPRSSSSRYQFVKKLDLNGNQIAEKSFGSDDTGNVETVTVKPNSTVVNIFYTTEENGNSINDYIYCCEFDLSNFRPKTWYKVFQSTYSNISSDRYNNNTDVVFTTGYLGATPTNNYLTACLNGTTTLTATQNLLDGTDIWSNWTTAKFVGGVQVPGGNYVYLYQGKNSSNQPRVYLKEFDKSLNLINVSTVIDYIEEEPWGLYADDKGFISVVRTVDVPISVGDYTNVSSYRQIKVYKFGPPLPTVSISTSTKNIGDNTPVMFALNTIGDYSYLYIQDANTNTEIWSGGPHTPITLNLDFEGEKSILVKLLDEDRSILNTSNVLVFSKKNALDKILAEGNNKTGLQKIFIISDVDRYYEDNTLNQLLVKKIKDTGAEVYLISNTVSNVLKPLLR